MTDDTDAARGREDARVMENIPEFDEARFWVSHDATGWAVCYRKDGRKLSAMPILHDEQVARTLCNAINEIVDEERAAARAEGARAATEAERREVRRLIAQYGASVTEPAATHAHLLRKHLEACWRAGDTGEGR